MPVSSTAGGGASSGAIRAGGAFVELFAKDNVSKVLTKTQARLAAFGAFVNKLGGGAMRAGLALAAPIAGLFAGTLSRAKEGVFGPQARQHAIQFTLAWERAILALSEGLMPVLKLLLPYLQMFSQFAKQNAGVVQLIAGTAAALLTLGLACKALAVMSAVASLAIGALNLTLKAVVGLFALARVSLLLLGKATIVALAKLVAAGFVALFFALKTTILALLSPVGLLIGGLIAMAAAFISMADWGKLFGKLGETGRAAIGGIVDAIKSGQLELAWKIALAGLKLAWHDVVEWMKQQLNTIIGKAGNSGVGKIGGAIGGGLLGMKLGSVFGPWGSIIGGVIGAVGGGIGGNELDKAAQQGVFTPAAPGSREALEQELALLLRQVNRSSPAQQLRLATEATKGLFQSPNFARALGYGDSVAQRSLAVQERMAGGIDKIVANTEGGFIPRLQ